MALEDVRCGAAKSVALAATTDITPARRGALRVQSLALGHRTAIIARPTIGGAIRGLEARLRQCTSRRDYAGRLAGAHSLSIRASRIRSRSPAFLPFPSWPERRSLLRRNACMYIEDLPGKA